MNEPSLTLLDFLFLLLMFFMGGVMWMIADYEEYTKNNHSQFKKLWEKLSKEKYD